MALLDDRESRLFVDGKLVAGSGGTFPNVNPATEEVLGVAADADSADMGPAIGAARKAFDETDWSTTSNFVHGASGSCSRRCAITSRNCATSPFRRLARQ